MAVGLHAPTNICSVPGLRLASVGANIRYMGRDDLVLIEICEQASVAAVFTQNQFAAAPVLMAKKHLNAVTPRYLLINAGNANAGTGQSGMDAALITCVEMAKHGKCKPEEVLPFSTGIISVQFPSNKVIACIPQLIGKLDANNWLSAAKSIMTTDTLPKARSKQVKIRGTACTVTGIAKGAGMIAPNMATMLAFVATDLQVTIQNLKSMLSSCVDTTFNCISVDGDTSTNDSCVLIATGKSNLCYEELSIDEKKEIENAIHDVFADLAQSIVRDAEGATKFITINVRETQDFDSAKQIAMTIANSPLVKIACFASDPNWGRILAAVGRAPARDIKVDQLSLYINQLCVFKNGKTDDGYTEQKGAAEMKKDELIFTVELNLGTSSATVWTSDLSFDYVKINAEYRT